MKVMDLLLKKPFMVKYPSLTKEEMETGGKTLSIFIVKSLK